MKRNNIIHIALIFMFSISAISFLASASWATTYYVSTSGSDSNNGTATATPFKTVQKSLDTVRPGDIVNIMAGTYSESLVLKTSGTSSSRITIQHYNSDTVTLNAPSNTRNVRLSFSSGGYYTFSHLNFKASRYVYNGNKDYSVDLGVGGPSWWGSAPSMATAPTLDDPSYSPNMTMGDNNGYNGFIVEYCNITGSIGLYGHNNIIRYCNLEGNETFTNGIYNSSIVCHHNLYTHNVIHGYVNRSIWLLDNINYDVISYNTFSNDAITADHVGPDIDCVPEPGHNNTIVGNISFNMHRGIEFENQFNGTIEGNIVYNVTDYGIGIVAYGADQGVSTEYRSYDQKNIVRNNIVYNSNNAISTISSRANYIVNNTIDGNNASQGAINIGNNGTAFAGNNTYIANNIITNNRIGLTNQSATGLVIINNLFYGNTSNGTIGSSYQTGNPLFKDRANYDFNIQATSPAIDKGTTPIITVSTDFTGTTTRPQGAAYDIGAYEYGTTTTIALLPPPTNLRVQ